MTLQLADTDATYDYDVEVSVPQKGGEPERQGFMARFKLVPGVQDEGLSDREFFERVLVGWEGVVINGRQVEFSDEARDMLAAHDYVTIGLGVAYNKFARGLPAKNSRPPPASGQAAETKP